MYNNYYRDKIALVTGGGSGIGRELCLKLAAGGATVICADIDLAKAAETVALDESERIFAKQLDVSKLSEFEKVISDVVANYGKLDLVFNNAGIALSGEMRDISTEEWERVFDINFFGVLYGSQTAYQYMLKQGSGQIVNIASLAGLMDYLVLMAPYSVTKHAVVNYTKLLRTEAKALGVKVSVVCPGFIRTNIAINATTVNANEKWDEKSLKLVEEKGLGPHKAADYILKRVRRNKGVIVFPFVYRPLLWLTILFKGVYKIVVRKNLKDYREKYRNNTVT